MKKVYLWPDNTWEFEEEIDDIEWFLVSGGKSDDYTTYEIPDELDAEDINELISMDALPGMTSVKPDVMKGKIEIPDVMKGKIEIPDGSVLVIRFQGDLDFNAVTILNDRLVVNAPNISVEIL